MGVYIENLQSLGHGVTLLPHTNEQVVASKSGQVETLNQIAETIMITHRPRMLVIQANTRAMEI